MVHIYMRPGAFMLSPKHVYKRKTTEPDMPDTMPAIPNPVVEVKTASKTVRIGNDQPIAFLAGPCALESRDHALMMSNALAEIGERTGAHVIYKTSFDKANRTSVSGYRGLPLDEALRIFEDVTSETGLPVVTDVHTAEQCALVAESAHMLQIPAYLCRQTDLLLAAAATGRAVNVKKGQFLAPWDMKHVVGKLLAGGASDILVCERGVTFGYNTLVTDFRAIPELRATGCPVVFDATHSVQQPGGKGGSSGGQREYVPVLATAAASIGVGAIFMETHQDPDNAPSDGPNMVPLDQAEALIRRLQSFDALAKNAA